MSDLTTGNRAAPRVVKTRRILRLREVEDRVGMRKSSIYRAIEAGQFPRPVAILAGGRASGWLEEVEDFIAACMAARDQAVAG